MPEKHRNGSLESEKRIVRYKDERRRQLAAQVASRLHSASSSEEEDQSDRRSYTEYKRRRRKERDHKSSSKNSSRHNLTSSGGELHLSRSRGSPDPLAAGTSRSAHFHRDSPDPLRYSPPADGAIDDAYSLDGSTPGYARVLSGMSTAGATCTDGLTVVSGGKKQTAAGGSDSAISAGNKSRTSSAGSRSKAGSYGSMDRRGSFDSRGSGETSGWEQRRETLEFELLYRSNSLERYNRRNIESPEHIYQVIPEPSNSTSATRLSRRRPSPSEQQCEIASLVSIDESRDSLLDRPPSSRDSLMDRPPSTNYSPGEREGEGLVSPDLIKGITTVPRRRRKVPEQPSPAQLSGASSQPATDLQTAASYSTNHMPESNSLTNQMPTTSTAVANSFGSTDKISAAVSDPANKSIQSDLLPLPSSFSQQQKQAAKSAADENCTVISQHYMLPTDNFSLQSINRGDEIPPASQYEYTSANKPLLLVANKQQLHASKKQLSASHSQLPTSLDLKLAKLNFSQPNPESPGSVLSPTAQTLSASKPPIFPTPERVGSGLGSGGALSASTTGSFKFSLRRSLESPPPGSSFYYAGSRDRMDTSRSDSEQPAFVKEFAAVMRRRSGQFNPNEAAPPKPMSRPYSEQFNPNEPAPPRPLTRPHSVYRIDTAQQINKPRDEDIHEKPTGEKERRKSDFLARYEELTCRAAQAIKSVDRMVNLPISLRTTPSSNTTILSPSASHPPGPHLSLQPPSSYPLSPDPSLPSPLSPGVESVEFNEEEVLKTCQDFLVDYNNRSKQSLPTGNVTNPQYITSSPSSSQQFYTSGAAVTFREDSFPTLGDNTYRSLVEEPSYMMGMAGEQSQQRVVPPIPAPRLSLVQANSEIRPVSMSSCSSTLHAQIGTDTLSLPGGGSHSLPGASSHSLPGVSSHTLNGASRVVSQLSQEDEQLLEAAQGKLFWESNPGAEVASGSTGNLAETSSGRITSFIDASVSQQGQGGQLGRGRSSSFSMPDPSSTFTEPTTESTPVNLRPILKKSSEDLTAPTPLLPNSTISILKNKDDLFGVNKAKRRSTGEDGKGEHVRIRSPSPLNRSEHVRIRTPSPDSESSGREDAPLPILRRSRDNSLGADISDSEIPSILKRRVSSEDLGLEDYAHSPEKTSSILKRKSSFGSSTYSGIQSPEAGIHEVTRGILKKSSRNSSRTCSRSASIEDLDVEGTKSILKSRNSSRTCSRSGSQDELDLDLEDEEEEWMEPKPKSILKKKQGSTDDELDDRPKSILKSRRSEESLSPSLKSRRSEGSLSPDTDYQFSRSGRNYTRHSSLPSDPEDVRSGRSSPLVKFPDFDSSIRPILKNRDDSKPAGILKRREKSSSPISATKLRRGTNAASPTYTASKSYSPSHHFYPVETPPSPEQIPPPWRQVSPLEADSGGGGFGLERQQPSPPPLLRPRTSTPPQLPCSSPPLSRPQGRQSSPSYTNDQRSTRGATAAAGGRPGSPIQRGGLRIMSPQQRRSNSPPLPPITPGLVSHQQRSNNGGSSWRPQGHVNWMAGTGHVQRGDIKLHTDSQDMEEEILQIVEQRDLLEDSDDIKLSLVQRLPNMENNQSAGPTIGRPPKSGGSGNIAGSAFISTSGSINNIVSHQPPSQGSGNSSRRRRKHSNSRFQTQPITVDEVEKARRGFMDPSSGNSPIPGIRSSPLYSMLRPLSLEELGGDSKCSGVSISLSSTRTNASSTSSILPSETLSSSSNKSAATNQYNATSSNQFKWAESEMLQPQPQLHSFRQSSQSSCDSSSSPKGGSNLDYEGAAAGNLSSNQTTSKSLHVSQFSSPKSATAAVFRPVRSPPPPPSSLPPSAQFSRHFSSPPPLQRNSSRNAGRQRERSLLQLSRRSLSSPAVDKGASNQSPPPLFSFNSQHQESSGHFQATSSSFSRKLLSSPPPSSSSPHQYHQYSPSGDQSLQYSPSRQQAQLLSTAGSPPPLSSSSPVMLMRPSSLGVSMASPTRTSSPPLAQPLARPSAFKPVPTRVQSIPGGGELTPVTGPIPLYRESSQEKAFSSGDELIPGILKNREHMGPEMRGISSLSKVPRKSILKNDFGAINMTSLSVSTAVSDDTLQMSSSMRNSNVSHPPPPARGVLKKDFSYDGRVGVSVASKGGRGGDSGSSGSSSEDVGRTFSDVVIDPIPGQGRRSAPETPIKRGAGTRTPVIPPSSVKISADGDLAGKLAKLSTQADNIKHKMNSEERADYDPADINTNNRPRRRASSNSNKLSFY